MRIRCAFICSQPTCHVHTSACTRCRRALKAELSQLNPSRGSTWWCPPHSRHCRHFPSWGELQKAAWRMPISPTQRPACLPPGCFLHTSGYAPWAFPGTPCLCGCSCRGWTTSQEPRAPVHLRCLSLCTLELACGMNEQTSRLLLPPQRCPPLLHPWLFLLSQWDLCSPLDLGLVLCSQGILQVLGEAGLGIRGERV